MKITTQSQITVYGKHVEDDPFIKFTAPTFTNVDFELYFQVLTLLVTGFLTNDYCRGGSLGPRSFFRLILTSFWTCGTVVDQYLVKGGHQ